MAQIIMGTGSSGAATCRVRMNYTVANGVLSVDKLEGGRDSYGPSAGTASTNQVHITINGNKKSVSLSTIQFNANTTVDKQESWTNWYNFAGCTHSVGGLSGDITVTVTFSCNAAAIAGLSFSTKIYVPGYATSVQSISNITETSCKVSWSSDSTIDYIWYSKDNGTTWTAVGNVSATSGSYTISNLSANAAYNIKTRVRRKDSQLTTDSAAKSITTIAYPYCNSMSDFSIGDKINIGVFNPFEKEVKVYLVLDNNIEIGGDITSGTSFAGFNDEAYKTILYNSIPNKKNGNYKVRIVCGSSIQTSTAKIYSIVENECKPIFTNFEYKDIDKRTVPVINDNQLLVDNESECKFIISDINKAAAKKGATISHYLGYWGSIACTIPTAESEISNSVKSGSGNLLTIIAVDSRGLTTSVSKVINNIKYEKLHIKNLETQRQDGVAATTYLIGRFLMWKGNWQNSKVTNYDNKIKYVAYCSKLSSETQYSNWFEITNDFSSKVKVIENVTNYELVLDVNSNVQIHANGLNGGFAEGIEFDIMLLIKDGNNVAIFETQPSIISQTEVADGKIGLSRFKDDKGNYHYGINCLPSEEHTLIVNGIPFLEYEVIDEW